MTSSVYLMLARGRDGRALGLTIATNTALASFGRIERWELAPRQYAKISASTVALAHTKMLRKIATDPDPWPDELAPLVQDLIGVGEQGTRRPVPDRDGLRRSPAELAAPMVWRLQHGGSHEQDRWDAMAWLELFGPEGYSRCTCTKCEKIWADERLADAGSAIGKLLAERR